MTPSPLTALVDGLTWAYQLVLDVTGCDVVRFRRVADYVVIVALLLPAFYYSPPHERFIPSLVFIGLVSVVVNPRWIAGARRRDRVDRSDQRANRLPALNGRALGSRNQAVSVVLFLLGMSLLVTPLNMMLLGLTPMGLLGPLLSCACTLFDHCTECILVRQRNTSRFARRAQSAMAMGAA